MHFSKIALVLACSACLSFSAAALAAGNLGSSTGGKLGGNSAGQTTSENLVPLTENDMPASVQKCYENAMADADIVECINTESEFWDKALNHNYKIAQKSCQEIADFYHEGEEHDPFVKKCLQDLKNTQLTWIKYRDSMSDIQCRLSANYMGTMQRVECASAYNQIVKDQALRFSRVYSAQEP